MLESSLMAKTFFIVNPHAGGGRARDTWRDIQPVLSEVLDRNFTVVMTQFIEDVDDCLVRALREGYTRIIAIGGDGTNSYIVNKIMHHNQQHPDHQLVYGAIPAGTGRDWARGVGIPLNSVQAARHVLELEPRKIDVGRISFEDQQRYYLNVASTGISHDINLRVNRGNRRPWSFTAAAIASLMQYEPEGKRIFVDGELWYEGRTYITSVANGTHFGAGFYVAPKAKIDDGLLDVIIAEKMATPSLIRAFISLYLGQHIHHDKVKYTQGKHIRIEHMTSDTTLLDFDGEPMRSTTPVEFTIEQQALEMLV